MTSTILGRFMASAVLAAPILASAAVPTVTAMSGYKWKSRPVVVFAPDASHPRLAAQTLIAKNFATGFKDRDMILITVVGERVSARFGPQPKLSAAALRQRFNVDQDEFRALLVGKDGGVKASSGRPLHPTRLFPLIDQMPMRMQEMKQRSR